MTLSKPLIGLLILIPAALHAQWFEDGQRIPDEPWRKSKGDYGVMLLLSDDPERFIADWEKPEPPTLKTTDVAERGKPLVAFVFFTGCREKRGTCKSTVDFLVSKPDGSEYASEKGGELWSDKPAPPRGRLQLSVANLGVRIEPNDPAGKYIVRAIARDVYGRVTLEVEQAFTVRE